MNISLTPLRFVDFWGIYRAKRRSGGHPRWAQPTKALLGLLARPGGLSPPRDSTPPGATRAQLLPFGTYKIIVKLRGIWTLSDIDFLRCKNMRKTGTDTWHYVNRLVPKNDIK